MKQKVIFKVSSLIWILKLMHKNKEIKNIVYLLYSQIKFCLISQHKGY